MTANLTKSQELYRISGHSPELQYKTLIYIVILVIHQNYDVYDAGTANIHIVIPVKSNRDSKSRKITRIVS